MSLISMHGAWLSFSDAPLLDNAELHIEDNERVCLCLLYTSPSPRDPKTSRMPSSA